MKLRMTTSRRVALVTGAGRGIGRGIACALAREGFAVVVNDLDHNEELQTTVSIIREAGGEVEAVPADISDIPHHREFVDRVWRAFGDLDCLVNNAGISVAKRGDMLDVSPESFDRLVAVNLRGPFFLTQEVARRMIDAPSKAFRSIITISSANTEMASIDRAEYCISKIGLSMMTQLFALRLATHGINVYEIRPGVIETAMTAVARERYQARYDQGFTPINRWGQPADVAQAVATLASGALAFSTGEVIHVDGGLNIKAL
nr:MAG: 3-ketoacyl-ACP reductase [Chloroflexota bacterium]